MAIENYAWWAIGAAVIVACAICWVGRPRIRNISAAVFIPAFAMCVLLFLVLPRLDASDVFLAIAGSLAAFVNVTILLVLLFAVGASLLDTMQRDAN